MLDFLKKLFGRADVNHDGKVDKADAKIVANKVEARVEAAAAKIQAEGKKAAVKAKETVKKVSAKARAPKSKA